MAAALLLASVPVRPAAAHGGPPLRIGVAAPDDHRALGRLVLTHLRDGVGYAVDWRAFPDAAAQAGAFRAGKLDLAVVCAEPRPEYGGEPIALAFPAPVAPCGRLGVVVAPRVLEDVRFTILPRELVSLLGALTVEDLEAVAAAERSGGEREAASVARARVGAKRLR